MITITIIPTKKLPVSFALFLDCRFETGLFWVFVVTLATIDGVTALLAGLLPSQQPG
jgi:hypothetical protein